MTLNDRALFTLCLFGLREKDSPVRRWPVLILHRRRRTRGAGRHDRVGSAVVTALPSGRMAGPAIGPEALRSPLELFRGAGEG
jgi:hypothetical protein